mgnify:CR=1 FL=1
MKILLVITGLGVGGAERLVTSLADRFVAMGHQVFLVRLQGEVALSPVDPKVKMATLNMRRHPLSLILGLLRLRRIVKDYKPDVVNSHLVHANILVRLLRMITPIPRIVSTAHNVNEGGFGRMFAYRLTDALADVSTNVSAEAVQAFEEQGAVPRGKMRVIHNGIDAAAFRFDPCARKDIRKQMEITDRDFLLLAVGSLSPQKDYPNLLKALAFLSDKDIKPILCIAGDGPLRKSLCSMALSLGVQNQVRFLGVRYDIPDLMSACDCFVLSSAWEGFGLVVAEAMACERPVVATDCGGVKEVVGTAAFLVQPRDAFGLSESIKHVIQLPEQHKRYLGIAARNHIVQRYSFDVTAHRYIDVYQEKLS